MSTKSKKFHNTGKKTKNVNLAEIQPDNVTTFVGLVTKCLGSCKFQISIQGKPLLTSMLPKSVAKKNRIAVNSIVFVEITNLSGNANSIILHCYSEDELALLNITNIKQVEEENNDTIDLGFDFEREEVSKKIIENI